MAKGDIMSTVPFSDPTPIIVSALDPFSKDRLGTPDCARKYANVVYDIFQEL